MLVALRSSWALFLGIALIMFANGLQSSLLGVRAAIEGFSTPITGLIMSGYFAGFLLGSTIVPRLVRQVGHIRVFAALASLASTTALIHGVLVDPAAWIAMRLITGFASAGLYVVAESWLNDKASNETRGQLLSIYMIVVLAGMGAGQFLLNVADPSGILLFIAASVLISLGLIPMLLTASPAPEFSTPSNISIVQLYRTSPLGVIGAFGIGVAQSMLWGLSAVYAQIAGFSIAQTTLFVGAIFLGGILFQWPLGRLSDRFDRRLILTLVTLFGSAFALLQGIPGEQGFWWSLLVIFLISGMSFPSYSICIAHMNDYLTPAQMVGASAGLYFVYGLGASLGPVTAASIMEIFGPIGFYASLGVANAFVAVFALYRMTRRSARPLADQNPSLVVTGQASPWATGLAAEMISDEVEES